MSVLDECVKEDLTAIIATRPDLTADEWVAVEKANDWMRAQLRPEVRAELTQEFQQKYAEDMELIKEKNSEQVKEEMANWKKDQQPLSQEDIQKMLTQEYLEFSFPIRDFKGNTTTFKIVELPQSKELQFVESMKQNLLPLIEEFNAAEWKLDGNWSDMLQKLIDKLPNAARIASELVAFCLNPWEDRPDINQKWVQDNISTGRQVRILKAQGEANRYRDFF